jgi:3-dehydroquinate synthetase
METITVELGARSYPIYSGTGILATFPEIYLSHGLPRRAGIVTDRNVASRYLRPLLKGLRRAGIGTTVVTIPPGERQKSLPRATSILKELLDAGIARDSALIALGGGVVGDLAGFVAAILRRGIPVVQVPTTLLAQLESSIGGKTAVNYKSTKNAVGAFHQPRLVFSDAGMLASLPRREIVSGAGELVKYGYLSAEMFAFIDGNLGGILKRRTEILRETIGRCNTIKAGMITGDERDEKKEGGRSALNLGHTIGQAIEGLSNYRLRHGEAVLIGLGRELEMARGMGILPASDFDKLYTLVGRVTPHPPAKIPTSLQIARELFAHRDRARFVLPKSIGEIATFEVEKSDFLRLDRPSMAGRSAAGTR